MFGSGAKVAAAELDRLRDVGRACRVVAYIAAEPLDDGVHELRVAGGPPPLAPCLAQHRGVGPYVSRLDRERAEQLVLGGRQLHRPARHGDPARS